jgi:hypothetical protein
MRLHLARKGLVPVWHLVVPPSKPCSHWSRGGMSLSNHSYSARAITDRIHRDDLQADPQE